VGRDGGYSRAAQLKQPCTPYNTAGTWKPPPVWGVRWFEELPPFEILTSERTEWGFLRESQGGRHLARGLPAGGGISPGQIPISGRFAGASAMSRGDALAPGTLPWRTPWRQALSPIGGAPPAQSPVSSHFARAITHFEAFRRGKIPFRGVSPGRAPCARAVPWRRALCPGERPGARQFAHSEALRPGNLQSFGISPGQSPISRRFAEVNSHFGAFRRGERHAQGRTPGARHFALANALAQGDLPIRRRSVRAISNPFVFRPGNHPFRDVPPGQIPISGRFAGGSAMREGGALANALAQGTLPIRRRSARAITRLLSYRPGNHPFRDVSPGQNPISGRFAWASAMRKGDALAPGTLPWRTPWR
jgi:hypothetical protein